MVATQRRPCGHLDVHVPRESGGLEQPRRGVCGVPRVGERRVEVVLVKRDQTFDVGRGFDAAAGCGPELLERGVPERARELRDLGLTQRGVSDLAGLGEPALVQTAEHQTLRRRHHR